MGITKIEWTSYQRKDGSSVPGYTFNPWRGCTKVSPGCDNCYAETMSRRNPAVLGVWGKNGTRVIAAEDYWKQPLKWNKAAKQAGERQRVFCGSLMDVFEGEESVPSASWLLMQQARGRLWGLIEETPHLDWLLLTKRPENILMLTPWYDFCGWPENVWAGTTVENQEQADKRIPHLLRAPARVRFLSCEPLLGQIDLELTTCQNCQGSGEVSGNYFAEDGLDICPVCHGNGRQDSPIDWVIVGGESGPHARPMHPDWARSLRDQCQEAGVPFFMKQWGESIPGGQRMADGMSSTLFVAAGVALNDGNLPQYVEWGDGYRSYRVGKKSAGRLLDGDEWNEVPE